MAAPATAPATPAATPTQGAANPAANQQPGQAAKAGGQQPPPAAVQAEIRKMKLKLDGKDVELPESEVIAYAQQGKVATQRFKEAAQMRADAEQLMQFAKANPEEFFKKTGMNPREWAEKYLLAEIQREAMSPEQRKIREIEEENQRYKSKEQQENEARKRQAEEAKTKEYHDSYEKMFVTALNESGLPKTPFTIARMAKLQQLNIKNGYELSSSQLAKIVREDYVAEQKSILGGLDGDLPKHCVSMLRPL